MEILSAIQSLGLVSDLPLVLQQVQGAQEVTTVDVGDTDDIV
jgi:hypothetical protein